MYHFILKLVKIEYVFNFNQTHHKQCDSIYFNHLKKNNGMKLFRVIVLI